MDTYLQVFLSAIIAFAALISVLGVIFNWLLSPVKENQDLLKNEIKEVSNKQRSMEKEIREVSDKQGSMEKEIREVSNKQGSMEKEMLRMDQKQTEIQNTLTKIYNRLFSKEDQPNR